LRGSLAGVLGQREDRLPEHQVAQPYTDDRAGDLRSDVPTDLTPRKATLGRICDRDGGVEVCTRDGTEREEKRDKHRACRERICKERQTDIPAGESLTHDAGAHYGGEKKRGPNGLGREPTPEGHADRFAAGFAAGSANACRSASTRSGTSR
jgi:hypothetical protein